MGSLRDRVALVTGAGQGSGRGVALAFAAEGAAVAVVGRTRAKLEAAACEIEARGSRALVLPGDVADGDAIQRCVAETIEQLGALHILVNAAQHEQREGRLLELPESDVELLWRTGPLATLRFMRAAHPHLRGGGSILNFGSGAALRPQGFGVYAACKEAIRALTRAAAVEWGPDGIRANLIAPLAHSPAFDQVFDAHPGMRERSLARIPLRRFGDPEHDVGRAAVFLCGPEGGYVTGQLLMLDGGIEVLR